MHFLSRDLLTKSLVACGAMLFLFSGCAATTLSRGAQRVRITHVDPGSECKYLGEVTGDQGNWASGAFTSNKNLETGARNDMKNKANKMGGNRVVLLGSKAGETGSFYSQQTTNITTTGAVYKCPENATTKPATPAPSPATATPPTTSSR